MLDIFHIDVRNFHVDVRNFHVDVRNFHIKNLTRC